MKIASGGHRIYSFQFEKQGEGGPADSTSLAYAPPLLTGDATQSQTTCPGSSLAMCQMCTKTKGTLRAEFKGKHARAGSFQSGHIDYPSAFPRSCRTTHQLLST